MVPVPNLVALPTELLVHIFQYLDILDLGNLRDACPRFRDIIDDNKCLFKGCTADLIVTSDNNKAAYERSYYSELTLFEKHKFSYNWRTGCARQEAYLKGKVNYMPWLQLDKEHLWISRGRAIICFNRTDEIVDIGAPSLVVTAETRDDVCRYIVKDGYVLAGQMSGNLFLYNLESNNIISQFRCHQSDIEDVDIHNGLIVTGSRDNTVRVWTNMLETPDLYSCIPIELTESVWCVGLWKHDYVAVGTMGNTHMSGSILDLNTTSAVMLLETFPRIAGAGIKQLKWQSKHTLWTCGYDGTVKKWDLRTGRAVRTLGDPCSSSIYCFDTDFKTTLLTGSQTNGRVALWDIRMSQCVQLYYMNTCKGRWSSPVYSLAYDPCYLFVATQHHLNVLDFTVTTGISDARDWTYFLRIKCY